MPVDWSPIILATWLVGMVGGGLLDTWLVLTNRVSISQRVWDNPWLGIPIVIFALSGGIFLAGHFWLGWASSSKVP